MITRALVIGEECQYQDRMETRRGKKDEEEEVE